MAKFLLYLHNYIPDILYIAVNLRVLYNDKISHAVSASRCYHLSSLFYGYHFIHIYMHVFLVYYCVNL
jgi:hypothetical protein